MRTLAALEFVLVYAMALCNRHNDWITQRAPVLA